MVCVAYGIMRNSLLNVYSVFINVNSLFIYRFGLSNKTESAAYNINKSIKTAETKHMISIKIIKFNKNTTFFNASLKALKKHLISHA
jgi:hypothetical protein